MAGKEGPTMSGQKRTEVICGFLAGVWGLLLLLGAYLQPYGDSKCSSTWLCLHPGFTPIEYPYLATFGVPLLGIALGAIADGVRPSVPARVLLVVATVIFTGETLISIASIGLFLMPAAALGITASILSTTPERRERRGAA
jgi:hypothetical protein